MQITTKLHTTKLRDINCVVIFNKTDKE